MRNVVLKNRFFDSILYYDNDLNLINIKRNFHYYPTISNNINSWNTVINVAELEMGRYYLSSFFNKDFTLIYIDSKQVVCIDGISTQIIPFQKFEIFRGIPMDKTTIDGIYNSMLFPQKSNYLSVALSYILKDILIRSKNIVVTGDYVLGNSVFSTILNQAFSVSIYSDYYSLLVHNEQLSKISYNFVERAIKKSIKLEGTYIWARSSEKIGNIAGRLDIHSWDEGSKSIYPFLGETVVIDGKYKSVDFSCLEDSIVVPEKIVKGKGMLLVTFGKKDKYIPDIILSMYEKI